VHTPLFAQLMEPGLEPTTYRPTLLHSSYGGLNCSAASYNVRQCYSFMDYGYVSEAR